MKHCFVCEKIENITRHHIIPIGMGSYHPLSEVMFLCEDCHVRLHKKINKNKSANEEFCLWEVINMRVQFLVRKNKFINRNHIK